jgi:hypothetical protein
MKVAIVLLGFIAYRFRKPESKVVATCKYLTTHQVSKQASVVEVSASFIGIVFSVTFYY